MKNKLIKTNAMIATGNFRVLRRKRFLIVVACLWPLFLYASCRTGDFLLDRILSNEIVFYGQVLDLEGNPVPNAEVRYSALNSKNFDKVWTSGTSKKIMSTDQDGRFAIYDVGGSLFVNCGHPEYYGTGGHTESSQRKFGYGF